MKQFDVYQQMTPVRSDREGRALGADYNDKRTTPYEVDLRFIGTIDAPNGSAAIDAAKAWPEFRGAKRLARYPIVEAA